LSSTILLEVVNRCPSSRLLYSRNWLSMIQVLGQKGFGKCFAHTPLIMHREFGLNESHGPCTMQLLTFLYSCDSSFLSGIYTQTMLSVAAYTIIKQSSNASFPIPFTKNFYVSKVKQIDIVYKVTLIYFLQNHQTSGERYKFTMMWNIHLFLIMPNKWAADMIIFINITLIIYKSKIGGKTFKKHKVEYLACQRRCKMNKYNNTNDFLDMGWINDKDTFDESTYNVATKLLKHKEMSLHLNSCWRTAINVSKIVKNVHSIMFRQINVTQWHILMNCMWINIVNDLRDKNKLY
jgi:hypothetical protein